MSSQDIHQISLEEAAALTYNYRNTILATIATAINGQKGQSFPKSSIESVLNQPGVASIRIYYGLELLPPAFKLIIVGVDASGNDITAGVLLDRGIACPPNCGTPNALNSNIF